MTTPYDPSQVLATVRDSYAQVVSRRTNEASPEGDEAARRASTVMGYSRHELDGVPDAANLGVGCGNPTALASLSPGETVVDLGSGAGLDAFLAARAVGAEGRVIGVDTTPEMLAAARKNAVDMGVHGHVEFREGLIEALPLSDDSADVVISNCVINLSVDKPLVFREAFRVLRSGGRLAVSDIVLSAPLPEEVAKEPSAYVACLAGAIQEGAYLDAIRDAGFVDVSFTRVSAASLLACSADPIVTEAAEGLGAGQMAALADIVWSYRMTARKP